MSESKKYKSAGFIVTFRGDIYSTGSTRERAIAAYNKFAEDTEFEFPPCAADGSTDECEVSHATQDLLDEYYESHGDSTPYIYVYDDSLDDDYIACTDAVVAAANAFQPKRRRPAGSNNQTKILEN